MASERFTKARAAEAREALHKIIKAIPKGKVMSLFAEANDLGLFISAAEEAAPAGSKSE